MTPPQLPRPPACSWLTSHHQGPGSPPSSRPTSPNASQACLLGCLKNTPNSTRANLNSDVPTRPASHRPPWPQWPAPISPSPSQVSRKPGLSLTPPTCSSREPFAEPCGFHLLSSLKPNTAVHSHPSPPWSPPVVSCWAPGSRLSILQLDSHFQRAALSGHCLETSLVLSGALRPRAVPGQGLALRPPSCRPLTGGPPCQPPRSLSVTLCARLPPPGLPCSSLCPDTCHCPWRLTPETDTVAASSASETLPQPLGLGNAASPVFSAPRALPPDPRPAGALLLVRWFG